MWMILETGKHILAGTHHPNEVKRHETTTDAQQHTSRNALYRPLAVKVEGEERGIAAEDISKTSGRHTRHENRQQRRHRHVDHQHLKRKHQTRYRRLEDTCDSTCGTTAHKCHQHLTIQMEQLSQVRPDGRASEHDRRLGSHRTTKANRDGRGHDRRPAVVRLQARLIR